jgi:AraC family transcriptional regulator
MQYELEKEIVLPHVRVNLATISWADPSRSPVHETHALFQRLSREHSPLRLGELSPFDLLPRVHAVGFLPAGTSVPLEPLERPLRVLTCFYDPDYVERCTGAGTGRLATRTAALASLRNKQLEILMQELHAEIEQPGRASELLIGSIADIMLVEIARFVARLERKGVCQGVSLALAPWQLLRIEERINASPEKGYPMLSELAELCSISQGHLARAFKVSTGWQIHKYVAEQRVKAAMEMLGQKELRCEEVARRLGFSSPAYFSTAFRERTGKTPSDYRRQAMAERLAHQDRS